MHHNADGYVQKKKKRWKKNPQQNGELKGSTKRRRSIITRRNGCAANRVAAMNVNALEARYRAARVV